MGNYKVRVSLFILLIVLTCSNEKKSDETGEKIQEFEIEVAEFVSSKFLFLGTKHILI